MTAPDAQMPEQPPEHQPQQPPEPPAQLPGPPVVAPADGGLRPGRAFAVYSALRLVLLVVSFAVLLALGLDGLLAIGGAVLMSALLSLVLLRSRRDAFTNASIARADLRRAEKERRRARLDET